MVWGIYRIYAGIMGNKMKTTAQGLEFRVLGFRVWGLGF